MVMVYLLSQFGCAQFFQKFVIDFMLRFYQVIILSDFNINLLNCKSNYCVQRTDVVGLKKLIGHLTRVAMFASPIELVSVTDYVDVGDKIYWNLTDHNMVFCDVKTKKKQDLQNDQYGMLLI